MRRPVIPVLIALMAAHLPAHAQSPAIPCDGHADAGPAINAAIAARAAAGGGIVTLPAGICRIDLAKGQIIAESNITLEGQGTGATTVLCDDRTGGRGCFTNFSTARNAYTKLSNIALRHLTFRGLADTLRTVSGHHLTDLSGITGFAVDDAAFQYSRGSGILLAASDDVTITNSHFAYTLGDAIDVWDTPNIRIANNSIIGSNDDAIGIHSDDIENARGQKATGPVRSGIVITGNIIRESQGPSMLGAKLLVFSGNTLERIFGYGLNITASPFWHQGNTPIFGLSITGNTITDVLRRPWDKALNAAQFYIRVAGAQPAAGGAPAPPGRAIPGRGGIVPLYGAPDRVGAFYANHTDEGRDPAPAGHWIDISGNVLARTLPAVAHVSQWGFATSAEGLFVGQDNAGKSYDGPIPDAALQTNGIVLLPAMRAARIAGNTIQTSGQHAIVFLDAKGGGAPVDHDWEGLLIERNQMIDCPTACVFFSGGTPTQQGIILRDNTIDSDPFLHNPTRKPDGSWAEPGKNAGIYIPGLSGAVVTGNIFRNVATPVVTGPATPPYLAGNLLFAAPAATGYSQANKGIAVIPPDGSSYTTLPVDADPASPTYGAPTSQVLNDAPAMPTTGTYVAGHIVANTALTPRPACGQAITGWRRLTTGKTHIPGTDWLALTTPLTAKSGHGVTDAARLQIEDWANLVDISGPALNRLTLVLPDPAAMPQSCTITIIPRMAIAGATFATAGKGDVAMAQTALAANQPIAFTLAGTTWMRLR